MAARRSFDWRRDRPASHGTRRRPSRRTRRRRGARASARVAAAALVPWPEHRVEPPSVRRAARREPASSASARVRCSRSASDAAAATTASSVGSADLVTRGRARRRRHHRDAARRARQPRRADADGTPVAITTEPGAVDAGMLAGAQSQSRRRPRRSRASPRRACTEAVAESWLVGGATDLGRTRLVLLANPTEVAATVDVRVIGEAGPVEAPSALGIIVPPGSAAGALARRARTEPAPRRSCTSRARAARSPRASSTPSSSGLAPAGVELTGCRRHRRRRRQVIPGFVVAESRRRRPRRRPRRGRRLPGGAPARARRRTGRGRRSASSPESGGGGESTIDVTPRARQRHRRAARRARRGRLHGAARGRRADRGRGAGDDGHPRRDRRLEARRMPRHPSTSPGPWRPCRSSTTAVVAVPDGPVAGAAPRESRRGARRR